MPTLLQITVALNCTSTGKIAEQIGLLSESKGWKCFTAHGARYIHGSQLESIQIGSQWDEMIHGAFYSLLLDRHGLGSLASTKKLIKQIVYKIKPDIIHIHNLHGYYINYPALFSFLSEVDIPVVWTLHDCWSFTGHCAHYMMIGCDKWKTECHHCTNLSTYPKSLFWDHSRENFNLKKKLFTSVRRLTLVPVSHWLERELKQSFFKNQEIRTIHNGIDLGIFAPQQHTTIRQRYGLEGKYILLGVAAPWTERKGLSDFIRLRHLLPEHYAIIMVGLSKKQITNLPEGILGIERTKNVQEMAEFYSAADLFINTTYEDNYPTVNLESVACGTPLITYDTGGSAETIDSSIGQVVSVGDINGIVEAIHKIESLDKKKLKKACREYALQHYDNSICFQTYLDLYEHILSRKT